MRDGFIDEDTLRHFAAVAAVHECAALKLTHFGLPVSWSLTTRVLSWPSHVPLPGSAAMGAILVGEA
jgi:hypothetical protein